MQKKDGWKTLTCGTTLPKTGYHNYMYYSAEKDAKKMVKNQVRMMKRNMVVIEILQESLKWPKTGMSLLLMTRLISQTGNGVTVSMILLSSMVSGMNSQL